jgi:hypothetical protein
MKIFNSKIATVFSLRCVVLLIGLTWLVLFATKSPKLHTSKFLPETEGVEILNDLAHSQPSGSAESERRSKSSDLIVRCLSSGESSVLINAQKQDPNNEDVVFASAYAAQSPDSPWLAKMQEMMPNNGLPNLIAASLHLEKGDLAKFKDELRMVVKKMDIVTNLRKQRAELMDALLSGDIEPSAELYPSIAERYLLRRFSVIAAALGRDPAILGESDEDLELGLMLANKLRGIRENSFTFEWQASVLEADIVRNLDNSAIYISSGVTIGERRRELYTKVNNDVEKMDAIEMAEGKNSSNFTLRKQFFAHLRADGEVQAIKWLMKETTKSRIK